MPILFTLHAPIKLFRGLGTLTSRGLSFNVAKSELISHAVMYDLPLICKIEDYFALGGWSMNFGAADA